MSIARKSCFPRKQASFSSDICIVTEGVLYTIDEATICVGSEVIKQHCNGISCAWQLLEYVGREES
jgi:hypothetical protein